MEKLENIMNFEDDYGFRELYDVRLRANKPTPINGKTYEKDETIFRFARLQISPIYEAKTRRWATGGYNNNKLILWENTSAINFQCSQGVISKLGLAILSNNRLIKKSNEFSTFPKTELVECNADGELILKYKPNPSPLFIYNESGAKVTPLSIENNIIKVGADSAYKEFLIDYEFSDYLLDTTLMIGQNLIRDDLTLIGKMRMKDDIDGKEKTAIITIPKVKLMSNIDMRLGSDGYPVMSTFNLLGEPVGNRGNQYVATLDFLKKDIDSDF